MSTPNRYIGVCILNTIKFMHTLLYEEEAIGHVGDFYIKGS